MHSKIYVLAAASAAALSVAAGAAAVTQPTLTGESFVPGTTSTVNQCSTDGGSATIDVTGAAAGPYPGAYSAHVALRYSPGAGGLLNFSGAETFIVTSGSTVISGTKDIAGTGQCIGTEFTMTMSGTYTASIATTAGTYNDQGTWTGSAQTPLGLQETFVSTLTQPVPTAPTDKDQCKKDGWKSFGLFKNQGDCVSYVATHGRNQAG